MSEHLEIDDCVTTAQFNEMKQSMETCRCFIPRGVTPTSKFVCVLPFPDGDARRHRDLSWFGQEKALRPAGGESLYYLAPKCLYRGEYKRGMKCVALLRVCVLVL